MCKGMFTRWVNSRFRARQINSSIRPGSERIAAGRETPLLRRGPVPVVAIVTPVRNRKVWTQSFLLQISEQTYPFLRIYIVDAESTDGTGDLIRKMHVPNVTLVEVSARNYWTGSTNAGVARALQDGCDYILTLNDDAVVPTNFVEMLVETAVHHDLDIVGATISYSAEPGRIWGMGAFNDWENGNFLQTLNANGWWDDINVGDKDIIAVPCLCGNGTLVKRSVFEKVGNYSIKYTPHYHGDTEFTLRASKYGIRSYVSTRAWIYNRFFDETDGAFSARNKRFFSLRSSNYLKPLLYILFQYCPPEYRVRAFSKYMERYVATLNSRQHSIVVRVLQCLALEANRGFSNPGIMLCSGNHYLDRAQDFIRTARLDKIYFLDVASLLVLRRSPTDEERRRYAELISNLNGRKRVLLKLMEQSGAFLNDEAAPELTVLLSSEDTVVDTAAANNSQRAICDMWRRHRRLPSTHEFRLAVLSYQQQSSNQVPETVLSCSTPINDHTYIIYFNIDVLCMGQIDHRARTGVYRYTEILLKKFLVDKRITVRTFFSAGLDTAFDALGEQNPMLSSTVVSQPLSAPSTAGGEAVFYPYFPYAAPDRGFEKLNVFMSLCDLFPVTNPEWFSSEATHNFRRQLRYLIGAGHIFCISKETQNQLRAYAPGLKSSSSVAYLGVELGSPNITTVDIEKFDLSRDARYILCIGTLEPRKNLSTVITAFQLLDGEEFSDVRLIVVGATGWNLDLAESAIALGDRLKFVGRVDDDDLWALYQSAVCTVFPSLAEGFGLPIVESFACGTPVITSDRSSMKEIASDAALLVDPLDERDLAMAMRKLLEDGQTRDELVSKGKKLASFFTWEASAEMHISKMVSLMEEWRLKAGSH